MKKVLCLSLFKNKINISYYNFYKIGEVSIEESQNTLNNLKRFKL